MPTFPQMLRRLFRSLRERKMLVPSRARAGAAKIAVKKVQHRYNNEVEALKNVSLDIHHGEFVCLLGPSGCGKSTLLYALAGRVAPSGGHITIDGKPVSGPGPERLLMFQEAALFPWLTVLQNLTFALAGKDLSRRASGSGARCTSSGGAARGLRGRAAPPALRRHADAGSLARALADGARGAADGRAVRHARRPDARPDAPAAPADLDADAQMTVVFVTHDVREALVLGDRVVVMAGDRDGSCRISRCGCRARDPDDETLVHPSRARFARRSALREPPRRRASAYARRSATGQDHGESTSGASVSRDARGAPGALEPRG